MKGARFYWLDLLRFLAAFTVLVVHARSLSFVAYGALPTYQQTIQTQCFYAFTRIGREAVLVFFVLSGFLVGGKVIERVNDGTFDVRNYAIDRFTRLYVPLVPALLLTVCVGIAIGAPSDMTAILASLFSLQLIVSPPPELNGPLWTLVYEFWFYAFAGAFAAAFTRRNVAAFAVTSCIFALFTILEAKFLLCWVIGALAYWCRSTHKPQRSLMIGSILIAVFGVIAMQMASKSVSIANAPLLSISYETSQVIFAIGVALFLIQIIAVKPRATIPKRLERGGVVVADWSYTLYLTHFPILAATTWLGWGQAPQLTAVAVIIFLAKIVLCLVSAWAIYMLGERHTGAVRRWLKAQAVKQHASHSAAA